jgi:hypothetical protein
MRICLSASVRQTVCLVEQALSHTFEPNLTLSNSKIFTAHKKVIQTPALGYEAATAWENVSKNRVECFIKDVYKPKPERSNEPKDKLAYYPQAEYPPYTAVPAQAQGATSYYDQQTGAAGPSYYRSLANPPPSAVHYPGEQPQVQSDEKLFPPATRSSPVYPENPTCREK